MTGAVEVAFKRLAHGLDLPLPAYQTAQSAGMDIRAALDRAVTLAPGERKLIPTGFALALPPGYEAQIRPRSGLAFEHGISQLNTPGTVDADYRGEIGVILINHGSESFCIEPGDRIAQMIVAPVLQASLCEVAELPASGRGSGGFGSTGKR